MDGIGSFIDDDTETLHVMAVEYEERFGETIFHLFGRTQDCEAKWVEVSGHNPSFYIHESEDAGRLQNHNWVESIESGYSSIHGDSLYRVETRLPKHVGGTNEKNGLRDYYDQTWEADVFYDSQFLIDTGIKTHVEIDKSDIRDDNTVDGDYQVHVDDLTAVDPDWRVEPRLVTIDIEVQSPDGFPTASTTTWTTSGPT